MRKRSSALAKHLVALVSKILPDNSASPILEEIHEGSHNTKKIYMKNTIFIHSFKQVTLRPLNIPFHGMKNKILVAHNATCSTKRLTIDLTVGEGVVEPLPERLELRREQQRARHAAHGGHGHVRARPARGQPAQAGRQALHHVHFHRAWARNSAHVNLK